jgi:TetR/AcrR family transcriptional repressor of nem operon
MTKRTTKRRVRRPDVTREKLLKAAFEEMHRRGFQAASLDAILAKAGVTKGALYHHFPDKAALGQAVTDEVVRSFLLQRWSLGPLTELKGNPIPALQRILRHRAETLTAREVQLGCPLNNLAQEMSPLDEQFRRRLSAIFDTWTKEFGRAIALGQADGTVRRDVDPEKIAAFLVAAIEGSYGLAKTANSATLLRSNLAVLSTFLDTLRPVRKG